VGHFAGTCLAKLICMTRSANDKQRRTAHVDQEKSTEDIFEHVIRGVRLSRLRELIRGRDEHRTRKEERDGWVKMPEPSTA
jgi:hypothetical protein